jgi:hypothetical protein
MFFGIVPFASCPSSRFASRLTAAIHHTKFFVVAFMVVWFSILEINITYRV